MPPRLTLVFLLLPALVAPLSAQTNQFSTPLKGRTSSRRSPTTMNSAAIQQRLAEARRKLETSRKNSSLGQNRPSSLGFSSQGSSSGGMRGEQRQHLQRVQERLRSQQDFDARHQERAQQEKRKAEQAARPKEENPHPAFTRDWWDVRLRNDNTVGVCRDGTTIGGDLEELRRRFDAGEIDEFHVIYQGGNAATEAQQSYRDRLAKENKARWEEKRIR